VIAKHIHLALVAALVNATTASADMPPTKQVNLQTEDGVLIVGDYYPPVGRAIAPPVILLHMYRQDRSTYQPLVNPLHDAGFAVLAIDMRGHGASTRPNEMNLAERVKNRDAAVFNDMRYDVNAAVDWIRKQSNIDQNKLAIIGASVGCSVAMHYASTNPEVSAIVCLSPGENYMGLNSVEHIQKIKKTPILLLATEEERAAVDTLSEKGATAKGEILAPGNIHGTRMFGEVKDIESKIVNFLTEYVIKAEVSADKDES
jgi:pimeloyl-ACP methyl ester carboxylesterase